MKKGIICVVYVDDTIFVGNDVSLIEAEIAGLGVANNEQRHTFELCDEGSVGDFLGIRITRELSDKVFSLTQQGLIEKVIETTGMSDSRPCSTTASMQALGSDEEGAPFEEHGTTHLLWEC